MPGPYNFATDRVTGGPAPADDANGFGVAFNESEPAATPNVLILRDGDGRAKVSDPAVDADIANRGWVLTQTGLLIPKSTVDAKGDLLVGTADNTVGRLPAGTDGQTIVYDSGEATGLRPADFPSGGGGRDLWKMVPKIGSYFGMFRAQGANADRSPSAITWSSYHIGEAVSVDRVGIKCGASDASTSVKVLVYDCDTDGYPSDLLHSQVFTLSSSGNLEQTIAWDLPADFWVVGIGNGVGSGTVRCVSQGDESTHSANTLNLALVFTGPSAFQFLTADPGSYASPNDPATVVYDGSVGSKLIDPTGNNSLHVAFRRSA